MLTSKVSPSRAVPFIKSPCVNSHWSGLSLLGVLLGAVGCVRDARAPATDAPEGTQSPTVAARPNAGCQSEGPLPAPNPLSIEDGENGDPRIIQHNGRGGFLYTFVDELGSEVVPKSATLGGMFQASAGGAHGACGLNFKGQLVAGEVVFAGLGFDLTYPKQPYAASQFAGISFMARIAEGAATRIRVNLSDTNTDPDGTKCSECYNYFGREFDLTPEWQEYRLPFAELQQEPLWGEPRPDAIDTHGIYGLIFLMRDPGRAFDVWIDDIMFIPS